MNTQPETLFTPHWSRRVADGGDAWYGGGVRVPLSMAFGNPSPDLFPAGEVAAAAGRVLADPERAAVALQYGSVRGLPEFMAMLADKLDLEEGLKVAPENLVITSGAAGAIGLVARAFLDEGDTVLVEGPTWPGALSIFKRVGAIAQNLPLGPDGIDVPATEALLEDLSARGERPRLLYTIPNLQNPTGLTLPQTSRAALLALARRFDLVILEDDAYRDLYYDAHNGPLPTSLYALDTEGRVVRTGTLSKILAPGMRIGWAIATPEIISRMLLLKEEGGTSPFTQHTAVEYGKNGVLMAHIAALVDAYGTRRDAMLAALERHFPPEARWTRPVGGFFVWATLPPSIDPAQLATRAREEGVEYLPGEVCFAQPPAQPGTYMRLSFSLLSPDDAEEAIKRLGRVIKSSIS
jgi:2-aminoadipate transaminase